MTRARLEFLMRLRYWLVSGGMMMRSAWGRMTRRSVWPSESPIERAASRWPLLTAWMPPRIDLGDERGGVEPEAHGQGRELRRERRARR